MAERFPEGTRVVFTNGTGTPVVKPPVIGTTGTVRCRDERDPGLLLVLWDSVDGTRLMMDEDIAMVEPPDAE